MVALNRCPTPSIMAKSDFGTQSVMKHIMNTPTSGCTEGRISLADITVSIKTIRRRVGRKYRRRTPQAFVHQRTYL
jgi:hypothetical protein